MGDRHHRKINEGDFMARIIVTTDASERPDAPVLLEERVCSAHLASDHSAAQLIERLGWAITDAENTQWAEQTL
jgi:hypothetical protein